MQAAASGVSGYNRRGHIAYWRGDSRYHECGASLSNEKLVEMVRKEFDLRPAGIIKMLDLRRPIYRETAAYGHFGRTDLDLPWEKTDKVEVLKAYLA